MLTHYTVRVSRATPLSPDERRRAIVEATLPLFRPVGYHVPLDLGDGIVARYYPAGHMVYTSPGCLEKLVEDLRVFYAAGVDTGGTGGVAGAAGTTGAASALSAARVSAAPVDLSDLDERPELEPLGLS